MSANEIIVSINAFEGMDEAGFQIATDRQVITLAIDDDSCCCESWGYFLTEDDVEKFLGAELLGLEVTDTNRSSRTFLDYTEACQQGVSDDTNVDLDNGDTLFVDIRTSRGVLQFVAYNSHNGYYGHEARVSSTQLVVEKTL